MLVEILEALHEQAERGDFAQYGATQSLEEAVDMLVMVADELHQGGQAKMAADLRYVIHAEE
jgi:hypothetical protein